MAIIPQNYPLWAGEILAGDLAVGRVVAWHIRDDRAADHDERGDVVPSSIDEVAVPVIAFVNAEGEVWRTSVFEGPQLFLGDSRAEVEQAASQFVDVVDDTK